VSEPASPGLGAPRAVISESQVEAMISLLTDSNDKVALACRKGLRQHVELAEPLLRERLQESSGDEAHVVRAALMDVLGARLEPALVEHLLSAPDLERGSVLLGQLVEPSAQTEAVTAALDAMADQVSAELDQPGLDPDRDLAALTAVLARQSGLTGVKPEGADLQDVVLHGVCTRRRGIPLALCVAWLLVARRVGIPLRGVNMPGHFLLRHVRPGGHVVLDPFAGGRPVREEDCRRFLSAAGYPAVDVALLDATDRDMLLRTLRNLVMFGSRAGNRDLAARCARILNALAAQGA
jgi:regulator of sirC expression with transglutaminase-like and TPR domain